MCETKWLDITPPSRLNIIRLIGPNSPQPPSEAPDFMSGLYGFPCQSIRWLNMAQSIAIWVVLVDNGQNWTLVPRSRLQGDCFNSHVGDANLDIIKQTSYSSSLDGSEGDSAPQALLITTSSIVRYDL